MLSRRTILAAGGALPLAAMAGPGRAQSPHWDLGEAMRADCRDFGLPGMAAATRDAAGTSAAAYTDAAFSDASLFEIGSISKSLVAIAIHRLVDDGRLTLDARVQPILPDLPLPEEPITIVQLLDHAAGLPDGPPLFPPVPGGRLWTGFRPGERFSYSNTGYMLLGAVLEKLSGQPFAAVLQRLALDPIGMAASVPVLRANDRARFATGHMMAYSNRPPRPHAPLIPAPWLDMDDAAGSVGATMPDMARYIAFLAAAANGEANPVLSPRATRDFALRDGVADPEAGPDARYASGLIHRSMAGRRVIEHTGGMFAFCASMTIDVASRAGCFAGTNASLGGYRPRRISREACRALAGLPPAEAPLAPTPFAIPADWTQAGRWVAANGDILELTRTGCVFNGKSARLWGSWGALATDHPLLADWPIEADDGGLWWRDRRFARSRPAPPSPTPAALAALEGVYLSNDPWYVEGIAIIARDGVLHSAGSGALVTHEDGSWRYRDAELAAERLWFENPVDGRPQQLNASGVLLRRTAHRQDW